MIKETVYVAINKNDEIQWVEGSSSKTRWFRTNKYLTKAVEYHNRNYSDDKWKVRKCMIVEDCCAFYMPPDNPEESEEDYEIDFIQPKKIVGKLISIEVLDKIRAEIVDWQTDIHDNENDAESHDFIFERIYEIFDEYKAESEDRRIGNDSNNTF